MNFNQRSVNLISRRATTVLSCAAILGFEALLGGHAADAPTLLKPVPARPNKVLLGVQGNWPKNLTDLERIQTQLTTIVGKVSPAVVGVSLLSKPGPTQIVGSGAIAGSGVVVSEDGIVLTAAHVCESPGMKVVFHFPDGTTATGMTLGTDHDLDAGLMKIDGHGKWPFVPVGDTQTLKEGDWVLALGHPGGFDQARSIVARLGSVLRKTPTMMQTDCTLIGGDSGGPLFDMNGRVIAIHSRISTSTAENYHVPITVYMDSWTRLAKRESWGWPATYDGMDVGARGTDSDSPLGCKLNQIDPGTLAQRSGLKVGDIITKVNDQDINGWNALVDEIVKARIGGNLSISFSLKRGQEFISVEIPLPTRGGRGGGGGGGGGGRRGGGGG